MIIHISSIVPSLYFQYAELLSHAQLFATSWTVACQALLSVGILQARILEWVEWVELVAMPASRGFSQTRDGTQVFPIAGGFITS